jgi:hypothetical protein
MIVLARPLTVNDLRLTVRSAGAVQVADSVTYLITAAGGFSMTGAATVYSPGVYYPAITLSGDTVGTYTCLWTFVVDSVTYTSTKTFVVYAASNSIIGETDVFSEGAVTYINYLRHALRDFNPNKFYTLNPLLDPETKGSNLAVGQDYLWDSIELSMALEYSLSDINLQPPNTDYTLDSIPAKYRALLLDGARAEAILIKAINWAAQSYSYNMEQGSLEVSRTDAYKALADDLHGRFIERLLGVKPGNEKYVRAGQSAYSEINGYYPSRW